MNLISCKNIEKKLPLSNFDVFVDKNKNNIVYVSFFDKWLTRDDIEIKKIPTYYLDKNADKLFYIKYYEFENKLVTLFSYLLKTYTLYAFLPVNSEKNTPIFNFIDQNDLSSTIKVFLRLDGGCCIYLSEKDILFDLNEDLTIRIFSKNDLSEDIKSLIINLDLNIIRNKE